MWIGVSISLIFPILQSLLKSITHSIPPNPALQRTDPLNTLGKAYYMWKDACNVFVRVSFHSKTKQNCLPKSKQLLCFLQIHTYRSKSISVWPLNPRCISSELNQMVKVHYKFPSFPSLLQSLAKEPLQLYKPRDIQQTLFWIAFVQNIKHADNSHAIPASTFPKNCLSKHEMT